MKRLIQAGCVLLAFALVPRLGAAEGSALTPEELLSSSIARHDPGGKWQGGSYRMVVRESRPDGGSRDTTIVIDNAAGGFEIYSMRDRSMIAGTLDSEGCTWLLNGSSDFSEQEREHFRLTCDRLERMRNYYLYLWGMPMKLRDPGTRLGENLAEKTFAGKPALELRVTYDEEVGNDIWYVYFDPETHDMIGYRFYHDEAANDGEYIEIEGIQEGAGLRLPRARTWYTHKEDELLGTDTLMSIERP
jgi:hypothetical protein